MEDEFVSERDEFEAQERAERDAEDLAENLPEAVIEDVNEGRTPESLIKGCPSIFVDVSSKW